MVGLTPADLLSASPARLRATLTSPDHWEAIVGASARGPLAARALPAGEAEAHRRALASDGVVSVERFVAPEVARRLARASLALVDAGWPATYLLMLDDARPRGLTPHRDALLPPLPLSATCANVALPAMADRLDHAAALLRGFGPPPPGTAAAALLERLS